MKRLFALLLTLAMCLSFAACGNSKKEDSPKEQFKTTVNNAVVAKCMFSYADVKHVSLDLNSINVDGNTYTGTGKVTITDDYGDKYVGKVKAVYKYNEESKTFAQVSLNIETPKKQ